MSYVLKSKLLQYLFTKQSHLPGGPGPSLTTLGTPSPKRPRAMGWRDLNSNYYNIFYIIAQYTLCPATLIQKLLQYGLAVF